jgi:hypothetical protein
LNTQWCKYFITKEKISLRRNYWTFYFSHLCRWMNFQNIFFTEFTFSTIFLYCLEYFIISRYFTLFFSSFRNFSFCYIFFFFILKWKCSFMISTIENLFNTRWFFCIVLHHIIVRCEYSSMIIVVSHLNSTVRYQFDFHLKKQIFFLIYKIELAKSEIDKSAYSFERCEIFCLFFISLIFFQSSNHHFFWKWK